MFTFPRSGERASVGVDCNRGSVGHGSEAACWGDPFHFPRKEWYAGRRGRVVLHRLRPDHPSGGSEPCFLGTHVGVSSEKTQGWGPKNSRHILWVKLCVSSCSVAWKDHLTAVYSSMARFFLSRKLHAGFCLRVKARRHRYTPHPSNT